jgi:hypothetical protein
MSTILKRKCFIYAAYFLLLAVQSQMLFSQSRFTVLLPITDTAIPAQGDKDLRITADAKGTETAKSFFKFDFSNLPTSAKVGLLNLKLYVRPNSETSDFSVQTITILKGNNDWTGNETSLTDPKLNWADIKKNPEAIGLTEVRKSSESVTAKLKIPGSFKFVPDFLQGGILSLAARSPEKNKDTKFFSTETSEKSADFSKKPKLIVTYEIASYPFRQDWAQPFANAQHNSLLDWKFNTYATSAQARKLPDIPNENILDAGVLIYKNQPVVCTQAASGPSVFYVKQLNSRGDVLWSIAVDDAARCSPLIDEKGKMYYISKKGYITILDLNNQGNSLLIRPFYAIGGATINNKVTLGYDGMLYVPSDKGIFAVSGFPQLKVRWKYEQKANEINGPVSISPDESKAFFINVDKNNKMSRLIVLDNLDGSLIAASGYVLGGYADGENYNIPSPVVQNNSRVFVLDGFDNSNKLFVFDVDEKTKSITTQNISAGNTINTGISQPVIDAESNVFFVYNRDLAKYNASANKADVFQKSAVLDNASILIADASSNIYAIDPYNSPKKIMGFKNDVNSPDTFSIDIDGKFGNPRKNIVLAPDGTLYTATATNLIIVTPFNVAAKTTTINTSNLNTDTTYRASDAIIVEGIDVLPSINTILNSGGSISFKSGFAVKKGAQLICKTGF